MNRIDEIEERLKKSNYWPWRWDGRELWEVGSSFRYIGCRKDKDIDRHNSALIAHAPEDVKYLLDDREEREAYIKKLEEAAREYIKAVADLNMATALNPNTLKSASYNAFLAYNNLKQVMEGRDE